MELRCAWVTKDPEYIEYHDNQWGRPVRDSRELFAKLCLDGQQAGLSWITILKRTDSYYRAYADFDPTLIVRFDEQDVERLMQDKGIIRNRLKVQSIIKNARAYLALEAQGIDFADYLWGFVGIAACALAMLVLMLYAASLFEYGADQVESIGRILPFLRDHWGAPRGAGP